MYLLWRGKRWATSDGGIWNSTVKGELLRKEHEKTWWGRFFAFVLFFAVVCLFLFLCVQHQTPIVSMPTEKITYSSIRWGMGGVMCRRVY